MPTSSTDHELRSTSFDGVVVPTRIDIESKPNVYGWSAKVDFVLGRGRGFHEFEEPTSLLWKQDYILTIKPKKIASRLKDAGMSGYELNIEAEDTACGAEMLGVRLAFALLAIGVERRWGLALSWPDSPLPCRVIDRTASRDKSSRAFPTVTNFMSLSDFVNRLEAEFTKHDNIPYKTLLSMELFCSAQLEEDNSRSKLIMLTSALEALAMQRDLRAETEMIIKELLRIVDQSSIQEQDLKSSIKGQIRKLRRESVRRAIRRLTEEAGLKPEDFSFVEDAYNARSLIVHEGKRVPELSAKIAKLEETLLHIYKT